MTKFFGGVTGNYTAEWTLISSCQYTDQDSEPLAMSDPCP